MSQTTDARLLRLLLVSCFLAGGIMPSVSVSQDDQQIITPNFQDADIRGVTQAVMEVTGRNVIIDPRITARVTLFSNTPVTADGFYELYLAALQVHGYAAVETGNTVRVIPDATARQTPSDELSIDDAFVTRTIRVDNVGAAQLVPILRPLIAQIAHFAAHTESNMLVISDRAGNVDRIAEIIRRMDVGGRNDIEFVRLENASAADVVGTLQSLTSVAAAGQGAPVASFVADPRTNSIMLSGTEAARMRYRAVVVHLDTPVEDGSATDVRYLQYADAEELATQLAQQFGGTAATEGNPGSFGSDGVTIWSDASTNALVVNAPPKVKQDIMNIVDQIDIRRAQVLVEAIIVELSESNSAELGITWVVEGAGSNTPISVTDFGEGGILNLASAAAGTATSLPFGAGITTGIGRISDTGTSWAALMNALRGNGNNNIVSTPRLLAIDNEEAEIKVGQEVPFLTGQFTNTGAATGSVNPFSTIQRQEIGTSLRITPKINEGSGLVLTIEQETSSLSSGAEGAVDLITNKRSISTSVFIEDQQILVLGGMTDDVLRESEQRVPGIGRIPGLGWLFKKRTANRDRSVLYVFIRPTIIRDGVDANNISNSKYEFIREQQMIQAEDNIPLLRGESRPVIPELPKSSSATPFQESREDFDNGSQR